MYHSLKNNNRHKLVVLALTIMVVTVIVVFNSLTFAVPRFAYRYDQMSNSGAGDTSTHQVGLTYTDTTDPVGSITFTFCSNSPLPEDPCTAPTGLNLSAVTLASQTGEVNFSLLSKTGDTLIIDRNPTIPTSLNAASTYTFNGVGNPTSLGEFYLRIQTFSNQLGTGAPVEEGGIALATTPPAFTVTSVVPPYLTFCSGNTISNIDCGTASGDQINFGNFSSRSNSSNSSQFMVATNAKFGYSVTIDGDSLTSGNNVIPSLNSPTPARTGNSQFGINLATNSTPSIGSGPIGPGIGAVNPTYANSNNYLFNVGDVIASSTAASNYTKFTVSYVVDVNPGQPVGVYAATVTYICLANF